MRFVSVFFYVLAVITLADLALWLLGIWTVGLTGVVAAMGDEGAGMAAGSLIMLTMMTIFSVITHGLFFAGCVFVAEAVKIFMDIQENTQRTAFYASN